MRRRKALWGPCPKCGGRMVARLVTAAGARKLCREECGVRTPDAVFAFDYPEHLHADCACGYSTGPFPCRDRVEK